MEPLHEDANQMMGFCGEGIPGNGPVRSEFGDCTLFLLQMALDIRLKKSLLRRAVGYVLRLERRWDP